MSTTRVHVLDPDVTVRTHQHANGNLMVEIEAESEHVQVTIAVANQQGDDGLFADPIRLAAQLENAARSLRLLAKPAPDGDHFVRTP